jgi:hypothetical protein
LLIKDSKICEDPETIKKKLNSGMIAIYFNDKTINLDNFNNPYNFMGRDIFTTFSSSLEKEFDIFMRNTYIQSGN